MTRLHRRLGFGLATLTGLARRGWFIPYRYAASLPPDGAAGPYPAIEDLCAAAMPDFLALLDRIDGHAPDFARFGGAAPAPRFEQDWFPTLDAVAAYALVRARAPRRIVEVGSGHSTRVMARAIADGGLACSFTAIDPAPRARLDGLAVTYHRATVHDADRGVFDALEPGDMLFIDSSHVLMPGSDVDLLFNQVLPRLAPGVIVHIHDIFLPDDYPAAWGWRGYNEQQGVACLLQGGWRLLWASHYVRTRLADRLTTSVIARLPCPAGSLPASIGHQGLQGILSCRRWTASPPI